MDSGCLCKGKSSGRPRVPHADVESVRETYQRSPRKSLQLANYSNDYIFQQDGAPPHFHSIVRSLLNLVLPQRWIGRAAGSQSLNRAVETITSEMLQRVWQEFDYRIDVCRVTKGGHIEAI
ncbi:hypothetical protein B7P43_G06253 [Cryptotermes secundus]|uniref:Uncharacterized protein n=1 Tax=Cryptotermes secundus TaxID=105785 RepID=A0A2J7PQM2_9NEOP|nr:hypothetical protein B7P43_G06253 [Cryptotermes secundus]